MIPAHHLPMIHPPHVHAIHPPSEVRVRPEAPSLNELCARQKPPALLQALHERARWFHEYPTRSSFLLSLEKRSLPPQSDCA
ncbi:MAG: hypothetical protein ACAI44_36775 [Candidatus Sericytochromatia bacterium]